VGQGTEDTIHGNLPSPNTSGTFTGPLDAVSCTSASFCIATGSYANGPLIEQWNGSAWSVSPSPSTGVSGGNLGVLQGVSCTSPTSCIAVGSAGALLNQTLIEQWNGTTWSIVPSPNTSTAVNNDLTAISCPSASECIAVGSASSSTAAAQSLIEQWDGSTWSIVSSPNPAPAAGMSASNQLLSVSCPTSSACTAVGQTINTPTQGAATTASLTEQWDGTAWTLDDGQNWGAAFTGVSCLTPTVCVAVGSTAGIVTSDTSTFLGLGNDDGPSHQGGPVQVTGITPNSGPAAGGTPITITGLGFTGTEFVTFANGEQATNVVVVNDSTITAVTPSAPPGFTQSYVYVTSPSGTSQPVQTVDQFFWAAAPPPPPPPGPGPTVTSLSPNSGSTAGGTSVTIKGTNFSGATNVLFGTVPAISFSSSSSTRITAVAPAEGAGAHDVTVTTPNGTSATATADQFTSVAPPPVPAPTVSSLSPTSGPTAGGTSVTIKGTNFNGATQVLFGTVAASSFSVSSSTRINAVSPAEGAGAYDVTVTTPGGTSATGAADQFTAVAPPPTPVPTVTSISPTSGPTTGGTSVAIKGTGFTGATQVLFGTVAATSFSVSSSTKITVVAPAQGAGWHDVFVTTPGGTSVAVAADQFTYLLAPPVVSSLSTSSGPKAGGTSVNLRGSGFNGATQVLFGTVPATSFTVVSSTKITAIAPAGTGTVDVVVVTPNGTSTTSDDDQYSYSNRNR
jgi:hypothetical protein